MLKPEIDCTTGEMSVISSGFGITYDKEADYNIHVRFGDTFSFTVRIIFGADEPDGKPKMQPEIDEQKKVITLKCLNFNDFIGTGTIKPMNLATYKGRKIYFNFWVRTPGNGENREIRYCFYIEGENEQE